MDYAKAKTYKHAGKHSGQEKPITLAETDRSNGPTMAELATLPWEAPGSKGAANQPLSTRAANTTQFPSVHYGKFSRDTTTEMYLYQSLWNEYIGNKLRRVSFSKKGLFCGIKVKICRLWLSVPGHIFMFSQLFQIILIHKARSPPEKSRRPCLSSLNVCQPGVFGHERSKAFTFPNYIQVPFKFTTFYI